MNTEKIKNLIRDIIDNDKVSHESYVIFKRWLTTSIFKKEKEEAMFDTFNETPIYSYSQTNEDIFNRLNKTIDKEIKRITRIRRAKICVAASIISLLFVGVGYKINTPAAEYYMSAAKGSKGEFVLPDGSKVWLNSGATLSYTHDFGDEYRAVRLIDGEGFFDVTKDHSKPFVVAMDSLNIFVTGTKFNAINSRQNSLEEVVLVEGAVKLYGKGIKEQKLLPGERFTLSTRLQNCSVSSVETDSYSTWFNKQLIFQKEPISTIFTSLEHWYSIKIEIDADVDTSLKMSLTVGSEPVDDIMRIMSKICNFEYVINNDTIVINELK